MNKQEIEKWAQSQVDEIVVYICKTIKPNFACNTKWDWSARRTCSRGGQYKTGSGISIAMNKEINLMALFNKICYFQEYASFEKDLHIGSFYSNDWQLSFTAVLCHEIAHACFPNKERHGQLWKETYKFLREKFVNPFIDRNLVPNKLVVAKNNLVIATNIENKDKELYMQYCLSYGMKQEWYNKTFEDRGKQYTIIGWNPTARKYFVRVRRQDGRIFVMQPDHIIQGVQKGFIK